MKEEILSNLDNPSQLERLYRENKSVFKNDFDLLYPEIKENISAQIWNQRLNFERDEISWGKTNELKFVILLSLLAAFLAKLPDFMGISPEYFYPRNISFIVFPLLIIYFAWIQKVNIKKMFVVSVIVFIVVIYMNILPDNNDSHTLILACIHIPLFLWTLLGYIFIDGSLNNYQRRIDYLRFNGDLVVMTAIILIAGVVLSVVSMGLFSMIDVNIREFYFKNVIVSGLAASPIIGTYIVRTNPQIVNKVSPVIARVFTPLVLVTLIVYLAAVIISGKDLYNDREFLIVFNLLLIGVMAIILFSIAETSKGSESKTGVYMLSGLSVLTIIVNGIALSAIVFRISEWGISPNKLAVLGGNILILINLLIVTYRLFKTIKDKNEIDNVEKSIVSFLPVYSLWTALVIFVFPVLFKFI